MSITKRAGMQITRWGIALVLATLLVNAPLFFYERPSGWIDRTDSATEAIWRPGSWIRHGTEGSGYYVADSNGYLNPNLPLADGGGIPWQSVHPIRRARRYGRDNGIQIS